MKKRPATRWTKNEIIFTPTHHSFHPGILRSSLIVLFVVLAVIILLLLWH